MAEKKQLVLVVEGTAALGPYWPTIVSDYLEKVVRSFCSKETVNAANPNIEMAVVGFNTHGPLSSACLVQRSGWTKNVDLFLDWLSTMQFNGGGFCDGAIAEGLSEALMMLSSLNESQNQQTEGFQRHCILVAASNPYSLPTPVYQPPNKNGTQSDNRLSDAETIAKSFPQSFVSLSVICPRQLPKLKAIYNAGKKNPSAADPNIDIDKNPHYLVLISENFMEACAALCKSVVTNLPSDQSPIKMNVSAVTEPPQTSVSLVNESRVKQESVLSVEKITPAIVKVKLEPNTAVPSTPSPQSLKTSSPLPTSQEMISSNYNNNNNNNFQNLKPVVSGIQQQHMRPVGPANVNILNSLSQSRLMTSSGQAIIKSTAGSTTLSGTAQAAQQTSTAPPQSGQAKYVKIWQGELYGKRQSQYVLITKLEAYRSSSSSDLLAEDWPSTMQIDKLISQDHMNNKQYAGKAELLVFRAINQHGLLAQLQDKKLCTVIKLPSQTLLLSVSDKASRLLGMLFPGNSVVFKQPTAPAPQQRARTQLVGQGQGQVSSP